MKNASYLFAWSKMWSQVQIGAPWLPSGLFLSQRHGATTDLVHCLILCPTCTLYGPNPRRQKLKCHHALKDLSTGSENTMKESRRKHLGKEKKNRGSCFNFFEGQHEKKKCFCIPGRQCLFKPEEMEWEELNPIWVIWISLVSLHFVRNWCLLLQLNNDSIPAPITPSIPKNLPSISHGKELCQKQLAVARMGVK